MLRRRSEWRWPLDQARSSRGNIPTADRERSEAMAQACWECWLCAATPPDVSWQPCVVGVGLIPSGHGLAMCRRNGSGQAQKDVWPLDRYVVAQRGLEARLEPCRRHPQIRRWEQKTRGSALRPGPTPMAWDILWQWDNHNSWLRFIKSRQNNVLYSGRTIIVTITFW